MRDINQRNTYTKYLFQPGSFISRFLCCWNTWEIGVLLPCSLTVADLDPTRGIYQDIQLKISGLKPPKPLK